MNGVTEETTALVVVGDTFGALASIGRVQTVSQFAKALRSGAALPDRIVAGQGVSDYELEYLTAELRAKRAAAVSIEPSAVERVSRGVAHKHRETNVLLADLERVTDDAFEANLRLHADNELLQDHLTGQHVQGIVVIEALRQMFIAVFEAAHGLRMAERQFYVVWDRMDITFTTFLFPLPARISCRIVEEDLTDLSRMAFRVDMNITQNGVEAARADVGFGVHDHDKISAIESRRADKAVTALLGDAVPAQRTAPTGAMA